jgi:molybdopterin converting factor small subunit
MNIHVSMLGPVKNPFAKSELQFDLEEGTTIENLFSTRFDYSPDEMSQLMFLIDREAVPPAYHLKDGECITVFLPVGGG